MIDYNKPTAQMLGRWQPFHDGHLALFKEILKKTGQVCIMVRTMTKSENNPFEFEDIKKELKKNSKTMLENLKLLKFLILPIFVMVEMWDIKLKKLYFQKKYKKYLPLK